MVDIARGKRISSLTTNDIWISLRGHCTCTSSEKHEDLDLAAANLYHFCESLDYGRGIFCIQKQPGEFLLFHITRHFIPCELELRSLTPIFGGRFNIDSYYWAFKGDKSAAAFLKLAQFLEENRFIDMNAQAILAMIIML